MPIYLAWRAPDLLASVRKACPTSLRPGERVSLRTPPATHRRRDAPPLSLVKSRPRRHDDLVPNYETDPRVDAYIETLPAWQRAICREVRDLVHAADPEVVETIKRTRQPYFTLQGNICALLAAKGWVNVFLYDGAIVPDPEGIITGGRDNKTARTVAIQQGERINTRALKAMFKQIIANNRAGGWRKLKSAQVGKRRARQS